MWSSAFPLLHGWGKPSSQAHQLTSFCKPPSRIKTWELDARTPVSRSGAAPVLLHGRGLGIPGPAGTETRPGFATGARLLLVVGSCRRPVCLSFPSKMASVTMHTSWARDEATYLVPSACSFRVCWCFFNGAPTVPCGPVYVQMSPGDEVGEHK